nr:hypothetical protein [Novosphingobium sp. Leaf2]
MRDLGAGNDDLAGHADRDGPGPRIEQIDARVGQGTADGDGSGAGILTFAGYGCTSADHGVLGGTVMVDELEGRAGRRPAGEAVAAGEQDAQRAGLGPIAGENGFGKRSGQEAEGDAARGEPGDQQVRVLADGGGGDVEAGTGGEVGPDLPDRGVEGGAGDL